MRILAVGGGSGGHVTPVVAVLKELRAKQPKVELRFWVDKKFAPQARTIMASFDDSIAVHTIAAGKLRRYHHLTFFQHLLWPSLMFKNLGDLFLVGLGFIQSFFKLLIWRPDVVFTKGGYVCLPVGMAAHVLKIPLVIHDSDAHPGLTNRILARWATSIGTGAPLEYYNYPRSRAKYTGIPINANFVPFTKNQQWDAKREWGINPDAPLVVVTGGGLGALRLNNTVVSILKKLKKTTSVVLLSGVGQYDELKAELPENSDSFQLHAFTNKMPQLLGAADVVVTRAGATTILELAALAKPTILVPNAALTGGHQLKNAAVYNDAKAAIVLDEDEMVDSPEQLLQAIAGLLDNPKSTQAMAKRFATFAKPNAAKDMAKLILAARR
ncbi:MAG: UDP-N-acetylglucosamine--N-acetylmuramyl-(pentapeptide) pyrophosphoryl-undecaprenol N-acetylglucosamine transferase [Candidatus Microsaccharimonas sp.]